MPSSSRPPRRLATRLLLPLLCVALAVIGATPALAETENNGSMATANPLAIGVAGAQNSAIMPAADVDFYRFEAQANVTYTVEVLNVDPTVQLGLAVLNAAGTTLDSVNGYSGNGTGNVYNRLQVTPTVAQTVYVRVRAYSSTQSGTYTVRVLPDFSHGLTWDATGEPNDAMSLAQSIPVGVAGTAASLYPRGSFRLAYGDVDFYRFEAQANVTYTVEVLNVDPTVQLGLAVLNAAGTTLDSVNGYSGNGTGNVYNRLQVTPTVAQTVYVRVRAYSSTQSGTYTVRVLPDFSHGLTWDATGEPNDAMSLAGAAPLGTALSWTLYPRNSAFRTVTSDVDFYRWTATAGTAYNLTGTAPGVDMQIRVYNEAGTEVAFGTCSAGRQCSVTTSTTITQTYYARYTTYYDSANSGVYGMCIATAVKPCLTFWDVPVGSQFYNEISWLAARGVTTGYQDGSYRPLSPINRDAMAAFLYRLAGSPAFTPTKQTFVDVPRTSQFYKEIEWLATQGITSGWTRPDGSREYRPLTPINRDAMATFLYRVAGSPAFTPTRRTFSDVPTTNQFYKEIEWMASTGITTGYADGGFHPVQAVNRDAMAAFLYRYVAKFGTPAPR